MAAVTVTKISKGPAISSRNQKGDVWVSIPTAVSKAYTFTHGVGAAPRSIDIYNSDGVPLSGSGVNAGTANNTLLVTVPTAGTVTLTTGSAFSYAGSATPTIVVRFVWEPQDNIQAAGTAITCDAP